MEQNRPGRPGAIAQIRTSKVRYEPQADRIPCDQRRRPASQWSTDTTPAPRAINHSSNAAQVPWVA